MLTCTILDDYAGLARSFADWDALAGVQVRTVPDHLVGDDLVQAIADSEIVVIMRERTPFPAALLDRLPRLRLLVTTGMRNASVDLVAACARNVTVCGTSSHSQPPAELTWALILGLARRLDREILGADGQWQHTLGTDLHGQTLGVVGLGKIGSQVARVGLAFGMRVQAWSEHLTAERAAELGVDRARSKDDLLRTSDVVTLHLVLSDRTAGTIGAAEFAAMKPSALLVNTSRAGLVDQPALLDALDRPLIAGYGVDVFDIEPLPVDHPLRRPHAAPVLGTPHLGYATARNYGTYFSEAVEDITAFLAGTPIRVLTRPEGQLNLEEGVMAG
jgi:phosphoglycerate dehydrogenase-like enzyme